MKVVRWINRVWAGLWIAGGLFELYGLVRKGGGDTLSASVQKSVRHNPGWVGGSIAAALGWLFYHWLVEPLRRGD